MNIVYRFNELLAAAKEVRAAQRNYLSDPRGNRSEAKGREVAAAAEYLDRVISRVEKDG